MNMHFFHIQNPHLKHTCMYVIRDHDGWVQLAEMGPARQGEGNKVRRVCTRCSNIHAQKYHSEPQYFLC